MITNLVAEVEPSTASFTVLSAKGLPSASQVAYLVWALQWMVDTFLGSQRASNKGRISSLFLISFPVSVKRSLLLKRLSACTQGLFLLISLYECPTVCWNICLLLKYLGYFNFWATTSCVAKTITEVFVGRHKVSFPGVSIQKHNCYATWWVEVCILFFKSFQLFCSYMQYYILVSINSSTKSLVLLVLLTL